MTRNFTKAEIERRLPVWSAMSDLWLDTEIQDHHRHHIAQCLIDGDFTWEEAEEIILYEVAPAVYANMFLVAGEWAYFDEDWLKERICRLCRRPWHRWWVRFRQKSMMHLATEDWPKVKILYEELRQDRSPA